MEYICNTQIDVQSLIDVQSSNRRPILKSMAVSLIDVQRAGFWGNDGEATRPDFYIFSFIKYFQKVRYCVQFSNLWLFLTFSNRRPMTSLTYASEDVIPVRAGFWRNDREATRPDSTWVMLDDKKCFFLFFFIVSVDKIVLCLFGLYWL